MKPILFNAWNPKLKNGQAVKSAFQPFSFVEQSSLPSTDFPNLYEVRRELVFTVLTRHSYGDKYFDRVQANADKELLALVTKPFMEQARIVMSSIYARDLDASMTEMGKLMDLLTNGQIAVDEQAGM